MRLLADVHISPATVTFVGNELGHDIVRVADLMPASASDESIVQAAIAANRTVLTQDLDFSALMAISGRRSPSIVTLRLSSARTTHVNAILERALPAIEAAVDAGSLITIEDRSIRIRALPLP